MREHLAITELGLDIRAPDDLVYVERVRAELRDARRRARASLKNRPRRAYRLVPGRCAECNVPYDQHTAGCTRCDARHYGRARSADAASDASSSLLHG